MNRPARGGTKEGMCRRITCETCEKPTYVGCGDHIEQVLGDVPEADRCQGHDDDKSVLGTLLNR